MKIVVEQAVLSKALKHILGVIARKVTIPVLNNVLITAAGGVAHLTATDLDIEVTEMIDAVVDQAGAITVPAQMLYDIARELPQGAQISLDGKPDGTKLNISAGAAAFDLVCMPKEDYPRMPDVTMIAELQIASADLARMIDKTKMAISTEETRYYLCGIFLHVMEGKTLRAVATDGHRMAVYSVDAPPGSDHFPSIIIPSKTVSEIRRMLDDASGVVTFGANETKLSLTVDKIRMVSKLVDASFPDYERVIPPRNGHTLTALTVDFAKAISLATIVSTAKTKAVKLSLTKNKATMSAQDSDRGSAQNDINIEFDGPDVEIGFNSAYAREMLQQVSGKELRVIILDPGSAFRFEDTEDSRFLHIIMPLRV